jgi:hypothetical protein
VGQVRINLQLLWRTSRFTSAIERSGKWKKVRATAWPQFGANERSPINVYRNACYLVTFVSVSRFDHLNFEPVVLLSSAIERSGKWKKVR